MPLASQERVEGASRFGRNWSRFGRDSSRKRDSILIRSRFGRDSVAIRSRFGRTDADTDTEDKAQNTKKARFLEGIGLHTIARRRAILYRC